MFEPPDLSAHEPSFFLDTILFLLAAVLVVPLFRWLRLNPILGYLVAGGVVGPFGLALVGDVEGTHHLAEFGIVFMLFTIGLELSPDRLKVMARYVFGLGTLQVGVTGAVLGLGAVGLGASLPEAAVIGGALALSSTAFVLQLLHERRELPTRLGRITLSILLLQDLAVVPGIAVVTALASGPDVLPAALAAAALKAVLALALLLAAGKFILRPLYRIIASTRSPELFAAATLLVVLGTAWLTARAGLSMPLGAFLAGLTLAGTQYRHQIEADIRPVRGILLGLFFMSIGMLINTQLVAAELPTIIGLVAAVVLIKTAVIAVLGRIFGVPLSLSLNAGLHLSQGGEFGFVLFSLAMGSAVLPSETGQLLLAVVAVSLALTPLLAAAGRRLQMRMERAGLGTTETIAQETDHYADHVIIAGFGRVGRTLARILQKHGQPWLSLDADPARVARSREEGLPVFYGDAAGHSILRVVGAERARAAVITLDDPEASAAAVHALRQIRPDLPIIVRAHDREHLDELAGAGATHIVPEMTESSLLLGSAVLKTLGATDEEAQELIGALRLDYYAELRDIKGSTLPARS